LTNATDLLVKEFKYATKNMENAQGPSEILYYFSAVYAVIQRIFNIEYDSSLVYAHFILNETYKAFTARLQATQEGKDTVVSLTGEHFEKLIAATKELAKKIQTNKEIDETLKRFVLLLYSTPGNGYYLLKKGILKI